MTERSTNAGGAARRWAGKLAWLAAGFLFFYFLAFDPLGMHAVDDWLHARSGYPSAVPTGAGKTQPQQLWTCGMHPHILEEEPGLCPICGMALVPVNGGAEGPAPAATGDREILFYRNPMDPTITSPLPAKDEMGMDYVPVYADQAERAAGGAVVRIDPGVVQNMNVQSVAVERRDLRQRIRSVGYLGYDQERMVTVSTKYSGWVEKVYANYVGEPVRKGQPLFEIYSPELVQTQQELLSALDYARKFEQVPAEARRRAEALVDAVRTRLRYWDISQEQIARLEETSEIQRTLQVVAPAGGLIMKRLDGLDGMSVSPGMEIFHIADLSMLWLSVEVFEDQVAWIRQGTPAEVTFTYFRGESFRGTVRFLEPEFSEQTRTLRVKLAVPNPDGRLRSGMFATVVFTPTAAPQALAVPSHSVLRTGQRNLVVVELGNGRFEPREVVLGHEGEGYAAVLEGIEEGERVVTSAQFLIDSEASLQEAVQKMLAQRTATKG